MPNGHERKEYGGHKYSGHDGRNDCTRGCGCWVGSSNSGGPLGLDPFGTCPNNPVDGIRREGNTDYYDVVETRIRDLESRLYHAETFLKEVDPDKAKLADELALDNMRVRKFRVIFEDIQALLKRAREVDEKPI